MALNSEHVWTAKICGACGRPFSCCQDGGCWCDEIGLTLAQLAWLRRHATGCVCPACMTALQRGDLSLEPVDEEA